VAEEQRSRRAAETRAKLFPGGTPSDQPAIPAAADINRMLKEVAFGEVWSRPGLALKIRSLITVSLLSSQGRGQELETHIGGALNAGATPEEIIEALLQTAVYAGMPAYAHGVGAAERVFRKKGLLGAA
jgi:4-carboxymuconolactone decarboxylase